VHQRKWIIHFGFGLLMTNRFSPVSRLQPSRAHWKVFVRATAIELPKGLRINLVNPTILEESVPSMGSFFQRRDSVSRGGKLDKPTNALSWGRIRPRLQS